MPPPPPPPAIYDPVAGPFIVRLNEKEEIGGDQYGVIANAMRNWSGPTLQAFTICFRSSNEHVDWTAVFKALKIVSRELKARGAQIVVMPSGGLCAPSSPRPNWKGPYVEIMGVVRTE